MSKSATYLRADVLCLLRINKDIQLTYHLICKYLSSKGYWVDRKVMKKTFDYLNNIMHLQNTLTII